MSTNTMDKKLLNYGTNLEHISLAAVDFHQILQKFNNFLSISLNDYYAHNYSVTRNIKHIRNIHNACSKHIVQDAYVC